MTEDYVSFELARLAKEKGFREPITTSFYYNVKSDVYNTESRELLDYNSEEDNLLTGWQQISQPTQSLLQRWLREEHQIQIIIYFSGMIDTKQYYWEICFPIKTEYGKVQWGKFDNAYWDMYKEALEDALSKALQLIK